MKSRHNVYVLVPAWSGGIDRLFENIEISASPDDSDFDIRTFRTHGRSLFGLSKLPFGIVYYSSALFYTIFLLPIRLTMFLFSCLFRNVDVCHINLSTGGSTLRKMLFSYICRLFRVTYVLHLHGGLYPEFFRRQPRFYRRLIRSMYRSADRVIVLGSVWRHFVIDQIGVEPAKVEILPNAVAGPQRFSWSRKANPHQILFLGRLIEEKGIVELLEALSRREVREKRWSAILAGDGEIVKYRRRVTELGLSDRVSLPGWMDTDAVNEALTTSSIFVLPSHFENLPLSMLEAMAHGLCPVVTPVGSVEEVITSGKNGIVVPVGSAESIATALVQLLEDPEWLRKLGATARADFLEKYDSRLYRKKLETIYRRAMKSGTN